MSLSHINDSCKPSEVDVITLCTRTLDTETDDSLERHQRTEPFSNFGGMITPDPSTAKVLADAIVLENPLIISNKMVNHVQHPKSCDSGEKSSSDPPPSAASMSKTSDIFRERKETCDNATPNSPQRDLPTLPILEESFDHRSSRLDSRNDVDSSGEWLSERQSPSELEKSYTLQVEVDTNDSTQIEVLTASYYNDTGRDWDESYFSDRDVVSEQNRWTLCPSHFKDDEDSVINKLIENNRFMCSGLESWYSSDEVDPEPVIRIQPEPEIPRNRACHPEGRKKRIEQLKINLSPFELDEAFLVKGSVNSKKYDPIKFEKRNQSFSTFKTPSPTSVCEIRSPPSRFECYELPTCGNTTAVHAKNFNLVDWSEHEEEDLCYDSDPNELLLSTDMMAQEKKGRKSQNIEHAKEIQTVSYLY